MAITPSATGRTRNQRSTAPTNLVIDKQDDGDAQACKANDEAEYKHQRLRQNAERSCDSPTHAAHPNSRAGASRDDHPPRCDRHPHGCPL